MEQTTDTENNLRLKLVTPNPESETRTAWPPQDLALSVTVTLATPNFNHLPVFVQTEHKTLKPKETTTLPSDNKTDVRF